MGCKWSMSLTESVDMPDIDIALCQDIDIGTDVDIDKVDKVDGQKTRMTIFASSPFTDTKLERRALTCNILPKLQEKGRRAAGIVVTMYDMRYGVKDEILKKHLVWETCRNEIERCYEESSGSFFLSMQADKYGFCTIPRLIEQSDFESRISSWSKSNDTTLVELASKWYQLDYNCALLVMPSGRS